MRKYYCLYDKKSEAFLPLFEQFSDKGCLATLIREIQTADTIFAKYPEDYKVYKVLCQDETTGHVEVELTLLADLAEVNYEKSNVQRSE